ncbi:hypothetical protein [Streptomyces sp. 8N616]|uniref:hypothetical protein n=1 Tax=Streptomyces sp. 8N616 TaxID=3457414 RepID=UPI003FD4267B
MDIAVAVAQLLGGQPEEWSASGEECYEVLTDSPTVPIVVDGSDAITANLTIRDQGPQPNTSIVFRLADKYGLGVFRFQSASWKFAADAHYIGEKLANIRDESLCELSLEHVRFTGGNQVRASYRKPTIKVLKPWNDAHRLIPQ